MRAKRLKRQRRELAEADKRVREEVALTNGHTHRDAKEGIIELVIRTLLLLTKPARTSCNRR